MKGKRLIQVYFCCNWDITKVAYNVSSLHFDFHNFRGANLFKKTSSAKGGSGNSALFFILKCCSKSDGLIKCLDDCLKVSTGSTYENPKWSVDLSFFTDRGKLYINKKGKDGKETVKRLHRRQAANKSLFLKILEYENTVDPAISRYSRAFLDHPVSQLYIDSRWAEVGWIFYTMIMLCHFIYSIAFSSYALLFCRYLCPMSIEENYYSTENVHLLSFSSMANHFSQKIVCNLTQNYTSIDDIQVSQVFFTPIANIAIAIWICLIIFTVLMTMRELTEFYDQGAYNWYEADTWIHIFIMVMFALCSFQNPFSDDVWVRKYQHHAAAWGVFATWIQMMLYMERTPQFGAYIHLLRKVARTILNLFVAYFSLITAFAVTFYLLFPSHYAFDNGIPAAFVKVFPLTNKNT